MLTTDIPCVPRLTLREPCVSIDIRIDECKRVGFVIMDIRAQRLNTRETYVTKINCFDRLVNNPAEGNIAISLASLHQPFTVTSK